MRPSAQEMLRLWLEDPAVDEATKEELRAVADDPREVEDRFFRDLEFGTGGLRGVMGAGTNRMNRYVIGRATQGLAEDLLERAGGREAPLVVIAHDSRRNSAEFALEAACVLAGNGIRVRLFRGLRPTPQLSFAVRDLGAAAGIVITASHNPPEYNGYKVYASDGGQLLPDDAKRLTARIERVSFDRVRRLSPEEAEARGLLEWLDEEADRRYVDAVLAQSLRPELLKGGAAEALTIVYTPLHGAGNVPVRETLRRAGFTRVHVVAEQEKPDGAFPTVKSPNPEERGAFDLAIAQAERLGADLVLGTDPDADRLGVVVKNEEGRYVVLSGNQTGALIVHYLLTTLKEQGRLPANGAVVKTVVTGEMGADIARSFGCRVFNTLTGFKYIGEKITQFERTGEHTFLFGYEESYGYLAGTYARDKDAVVAALLVCEAAAYWKSKGKSLYGVLLDLYERYGAYLERLESRTLKGKDGLERIRAIMEDWRSRPPAEVAGVRVSGTEDYKDGLNGLPPENALKFLLEDGSWFCLRPSGTEPKIKIYFGVRRKELKEAEDALERLVAAVMARVDGLG
ncbi:MAG: phosphoglucomutase [Paenibacillaceae bacterium ZCTH02-B3]|nr:MAG: phosphoglucomutase [Paenibacillaceae bacterium ZCTH02-B3]